GVPVDQLGTVARVLDLADQRVRFDGVVHDDAGFFCGVIDGGADTVELVELALDTSGACRTGHPTDRQFDRSGGLFCGLTRAGRCCGHQIINSPAIVGGCLPTSPIFEDRCKTSHDLTGPRCSPCGMYRSPAPRWSCWPRGCICGAWPE